MLLHAFLAQAGAGTVLAAAAGGPGDALLLSAVSMSFALGAATTEQFKHLAAAEAGPLAVLPGLRALAACPARIADRTDPVALQRIFALAMLAADPVASGVYYVDDHFVPYTGAKPVAKAGTTSAARRSGAAPTPTSPPTTAGGVLRHRRAVRLSVTLPKALAELKKAACLARRSCSASTAAALARRSSRTAATRRALGDLPAGAARDPGHAACHHRGHLRRPHPAARLGRGESPAQGLRRSPADHPVRARQGRPADPHLRS